MIASVRSELESLFGIGIEFLSFFGDFDPDPDLDTASAASIGIAGSP